MSEQTAEKSIALFSAKGGVGRSYASTGLAKAFARRGEKTLLVDLDAEVHTCDILLGVENEALFTLEDLAYGRGAEETIVTVKHTPGLYLLSAPSSEEAFSCDRLFEKIKKAAALFSAERIIFDLPGRGAAVDFALAHIELPIVLTTMEPTAVLAGEISSKKIYEAGKTPELLINRFTPDENDITPAKEIIDRCHARLAGVLLELPVQRGRGAEEVERLCFDHIAARLTGEQIALFEGVAEEKKLRRAL